MTLDSTSSIPIIASNFHLTISSIYTPSSIVCGEIDGWDGNWLPPSDVLGKCLLITEVIQILLQQYESDLLSELYSKSELLMQCIRVQHYSPPHNKKSKTNPPTNMRGCHKSTQSNLETSSIFLNKSW